jgi:hypothetical protein
VGPDADGKLNASDVKGQIMLQGASVDIYKDTRFNIRQADEKRVMYLKADTIEEVEQWQRALNQEIERSNTLALKNGCRIPEVVDWYFHKQTEVVHATRILEAECNSSSSSSSSSNGARGSNIDDTKKMRKLKAMFVYSGPGRNGSIKNSPVTLAVR